MCHIHNETPAFVKLRKHSKLCILPAVYGVHNKHKSFLKNGAAVLNNTRSLFETSETSCLKYRRGLVAQITKLHIMRFPEASCHFPTRTPKYRPQHPIPAPPTPKFSLNVRGQVPHSFKSHIKLEFCALSSSHFQISDGRLRTE